MKLYKRIIEAKCGIENAKSDLVIIHGLFGMSDNWVSIGRHLSADRRIIIPDLRNHGRSPHSDNFSVELMMEDLRELLKYLNSINPILLGHSMGGRLAMHYALNFPNDISRLIIADMSLRAPKLRPEHYAIFEIMKNTPLQSMNSIKEIELYFTEHIKIQRLALFILKNIKRTKDGFEWKLNFNALMQSFTQETSPIDSNLTFEEPTLFLAAGNSDYIIPEDYDKIYEHFPMAIIETIDDASHWLHADKPKEFIHLVSAFL